MSIDDFKLFEPTQEEMRRSVRFLYAPRALERVQHLVAPIHSGADLVLPGESYRILNVANDSSVYEMQFGCDVKLNSIAMP